MNELSALQILCRVPGAQNTLTDENIKELEEAMKSPPHLLTYASLWFAYRRRSPENVRGDAEQRTDIISLVRFAMGYNLVLEPFSATVKRRYERWITDKDFTPEQREWLEMIRDHIATSLDIRISDFEYTPFAQQGGVSRVFHLFGDELDDMLADLTENLVS